MAPPKNGNPGVHVNLRASSHSIVHGCPGVTRSIPRIETTVELRPVNGQAFHLRTVILELRTIQRLSIPSTLGSTDSFREYKVYEDLIFRPPVGSFSEELLGVDIPVLIHIPREITSSGMVPHWTASTTHRLCVRVAMGDSYSAEVTHMETFPVVIKVYDTLPLYRQYNEMFVEHRLTSDKQVQVELSIPNTSVGPSDIITLNVGVIANSFHHRISKSLKLKMLTFQIKEILECHEGGLPPRKEIKLFTQTKDFSMAADRLTTTQAVRTQFQLPFPLENDTLHIFAKDDPRLQGRQVQGPNTPPTSVSTANLAKYNSLDKLDEGIPVTHIQGFTFQGRFFSLRYEIVLKVKLAHSKDMDIRLPLVVCPFDRSSSEYLLDWIKKECDIAVQKFGKDTINYIVANASQANDILRRYWTHPILYRNTKRDWTRLGFSEEAFGINIPSKMVQYID